MERCFCIGLTYQKSLCSLIHFSLFPVFQEVLLLILFLILLCIFPPLSSLVLSLGSPYNESHQACPCKVKWNVITVVHYSKYTASATIFFDIHIGKQLKNNNMTNTLFMLLSKFHYFFCVYSVILKGLPDIFIKLESFISWYLICLKVNKVWNRVCLMLQVLSRPFFDQPCSR